MQNICETYARLFLLFTMFANIKSGYIMGNVGQEYHAWNNFYDEENKVGKYVDLTWTDNIQYEEAKLNNRKISQMYSDKILPFHHTNLIYTDLNTIKDRIITLYIRYINYVRNMFNDDYSPLPEHILTQENLNNTNYNFVPHKYIDEIRERFRNQG